jgi:pimeloyl-ACP methyl ester carboxylesterase
MPSHPRRAQQIKRSWLLWIVAALFGCSDPSAPDDLRRVSVDGYRLASDASGAGEPTVILLSGNDAAMDTWRDVVAGVNRFTKVVAYDRAGIGLSDSAPDPRNARVIANELHALAATLQLRPPYVLVAHSLGGFYARVFAATYPSEVAGLVLVDATHEDLEQPIPAEAMAQLLPQLRYPGARAELRGFNATLEQVRAAGALPHRPLVVLTSMRVEPGQTPEQKQLWYEAHQRWVDQVPGATHVVTDESGHNIQLEAPSLVIDAVRKVVEQVR